MILRRKSFTYRGEFKDIFQLFCRGKLIKGEFLGKFEVEFLKMSGGKYGICTSSGIHAFYIILKHYNLKKGDSIFIPSYTAKVIRELLSNMQINYILIDILIDTATIDPIDFRKKILKYIDVKFILITHLLGNSVDPEIYNLAKENKIEMIEDCAHAHGIKIDNKLQGDLGNDSFYSFGFSKLMNTFSGGMIVTENKELADFARESLKSNKNISLIKFFQKLFFSQLEHLADIKCLSPIFKPLFKNDHLLKKIKDSLNIFAREKFKEFYNYSNIQAFLGLKQLQLLPETLSQRKEKATYIIEKVNKKYKFLTKKNGDVFYNLILLVENSKKAHDLLWESSIDSGSKNSIMEGMGDEEDFPGMKYALNHYLQLPLHKDLTEKDLIKIIETLNNITI